MALKANTDLLHLVFREGCKRDYGHQKSCRSAFKAYITISKGHDGDDIKAKIESVEGFLDIYMDVALQYVCQRCAAYIYDRINDAWSEVIDDRVQPLVDRLASIEDLNFAI